MPDPQWRRTMGVNLDSVFGLVQSAVAQMDHQPAGAETKGQIVRGHIVLISSTAGQRGEANHADYAVTKGALISLTKSLSSELAPSGNKGELRCSRLGGNRNVVALGQRSGDRREDSRRHSSGSGGKLPRNCRTGFIFMYAIGRLYQRRSAERERWSGIDGLGLAILYVDADIHAIDTIVGTGRLGIFNASRSKVDAAARMNRRGFKRETMRIGKTLTTVLTVLALAVPPATRTQSGTDQGAKNAQQARQALERMVQALGGQAWLDVKNQVREGYIARLLP